MDGKKEIKALRSKLDNWLIRKNILNTSKRKNVANAAANNADIDTQADEFERDMLTHWKNLEKVPQVAFELQGLSDEQKEKKIDELKDQFCEYIINSPNYDKGFNYADKNRQKFVNKVKFKK